jgi:hypothetical protein
MKIYNVNESNNDENKTTLSSICSSIQLDFCSVFSSESHN